MKKIVSFIVLFTPLALIVVPLAAQQSTSPPTSEMVFISDTQQPMWIETILLKPNQNSRATRDIFSEILQRKPGNLYMLGDVVAVGYKNRRWQKVDKFLDSCKKIGTNVSGILGNHEIIGRQRKGEANFNKRFPSSVRTGYVSVNDSVAVVLLNSNFNSLTPASFKKQKDWYEATMAALDTNDSIRTVIVTCHHAPFSNSKVVKGSTRVQQTFVPAYISSKKAQLFITGHAHAFEHFSLKGKDFLVIGGGGGLHQPLVHSPHETPDLAPNYKPMFHYLSVQRIGDKLMVSSHFLKENFAGFELGYNFQTNSGNYAASEAAPSDKLDNN